MSVSLSVMDCKNYHSFSPQAIKRLTGLLHARAIQIPSSGSSSQATEDALQITLALHRQDQLLAVGSLSTTQVTGTDGHHKFAVKRVNGTEVAVSATKDPLEIVTQSIE